MHRIRRPNILVIFLGFVCSPSFFLRAEEPTPLAPLNPASGFNAKGLSPAQTRVFYALHQHIDLQLRNASIDDALTVLKQKTGLPVSLDEKAIVDEYKKRRIQSESNGDRSQQELVDRNKVFPPLTFHATNQPVWKLLDQFTHRIDSAWIVRDDAIRITSNEAANAEQFTRVYDAGELTQFSMTGDRVKLDLDEVVNTIMNSVTPEEWHMELNAPTVRAQQGVLFVRHRWGGHRLISNLLADLGISRRITCTWKKNKELPTVASHQRADQSLNPFHSAISTSNRDRRIVRVYPVIDLAKRNNEDKTEPDFDSIRNIVAQFISIKTWIENGGEGSIAIDRYCGALAISQSASAHQKIESLLKCLRDHHQTESAGKVLVSSIPNNVAKTDAAMRKLLARTIQQTRLKNKTFDEVIRHLSTTYGIKIHVDKKEVERFGPHPDGKIDFHCDNVTIGTALEQMLRQWNLRWAIHGNSVVVTSRDGLSEYVTTRVYSVGHLLKYENEVDKAKTGPTSLVDLITSTISYDSWAVWGGHAEIELFGDTLIVAQSSEAHEQIESLLVKLDSLEKSLAKSNTTKLDRVWLDGRHVSPGVLAIQKKLEQKTTVRCEELPLNKFMAAITRQFGIPIGIDRQALDELGLYEDSPITVRLPKVSLRSALNHILRNMDLAWIIQNDAVLITSVEVAETKLRIALYPVSKIVGVGSSDEKADLSKLWHQYEELVELVMYSIHPLMWDEVGGPGTIAYMPVSGCLVISNTDEVHEELLPMLSSLRERQRAYSAWDGFTPPTNGRFGGKASEGDNTAILQALANKTSLEFFDTPLNVVAEFIGEKHGIPSTLDVKSLDDYGIDSNQKVRFAMRDVSLETALYFLLRELELTWTIRDEMLLITTPDVSEEYQVLGLHPVFDILSRDHERDPHDPATWNFDEVILGLMTHVAPDSWDEVGGPASIVTYPRSGCLPVFQTVENQQQIAAYLESLRRWQQTYDRQMGVCSIEPLDCVVAPQAMHKVRMQMDIYRVDANYDNVPLDRVIMDLSKRAGVPIHLDRIGLDSYGIDVESSVKCKLDDVPLGEALNRIGKSLEVGWAFHHNAIMVTAVDEAESMVETKIYPATDLFPADEDHEDETASEFLAHLRGEVAAASWSEVGGYGAIVIIADPPALAVSQTTLNHRELKNWLASRRKQQRKN